MKGNVVVNPKPFENLVFKVMLKDLNAPTPFEYMLFDGADTLLNISGETTGSDSSWVEYSFLLDTNKVISA